ncbi:disease resistance protein RPP2B-like [Neltuma alba]|uniref:disease resistance protein RPP2B-like n=1 Tax=Neltuma alba TaxID=207710 RepID=UPI0010A31CF8|nr:disease resistance protein RPP2B-like [Prosopis alba]
MFEKHDIYRVKLLTRNEALRLFCSKTFKSDFPMRGYEEHTNRVLRYANGHPLAIVMMSSFLFNRRASDWSNALVQFKILDNPLLKKVLKGSFDDLDDDHAAAFLDIACFFTGKEIKSVEGVLKSSDLLKDDGIQLLVEKSLITIMDQKIQMHGLLQEMGKEIVRHDFPFEPKEWSRLWDFDDVHDVMQNETPFPNVEAIVLDLEDSRGRTLRVEALSSMGNLRLLIFRNVKFSGVLKDLSSNLRYISCSNTSLWDEEEEPPSLSKLWDVVRKAEWASSARGSPSLSKLRDMLLEAEKDIPRYGPSPLIEEVGELCVRPVWAVRESTPAPSTVWRMACQVERELTSQEFPCLRNMNLRGSKNLTKMPFFKAFRGLERLDLEGCVQLSQLQPSIAYSRIKIATWLNFSTTNF